MGAIPAQARQPGHAQRFGQQRQKNQLGAFCSAHGHTDQHDNNTSA
jgi:hypothetical protein